MRKLQQTSSSSCCMGAAASGFPGCWIQAPHPLIHSCHSSVNINPAQSHNLAPSTCGRRSGSHRSSAARHTAPSQVPPGAASEDAQHLSEHQHDGWQACCCVRHVHLRPTTPRFHCSSGGPQRVSCSQLQLGGGHMCVAVVSRRESSDIKGLCANGRGTSSNGERGRVEQQETSECTGGGRPWLGPRPQGKMETGTWREAGMRSVHACVEGGGCVPSATARAGRSGERSRRRVPACSDVTTARASGRQHFVCLHHEQPEAARHRRHHPHHQPVAQQQPVVVVRHLDRGGSSRGGTLVAGRQ